MKRDTRVPRIVICERRYLEKTIDVIATADTGSSNDGDNGSDMYTDSRRSGTVA